MKDHILSARHRQLIEQNSKSSQSLPVHVFKHIKENVTKGVFKDFFTQVDEEQDSKLKKSLYDVMSVYITLYNNLEVRVVDMLRSDQFSASEALDILVSFSIAEEGSNNMYIHLI